MKNFWGSRLGAVHCSTKQHLSLKHYAQKCMAENFGSVNIQTWGCWLRSSKATTVPYLPPTTYFSNWF